MKLFLCLLFCLPLLVGAQNGIAPADSLIKHAHTANGERVVIRCLGSVKYPPLYVVNGVIVEEEVLAELDPANIESIEVLRDEASAVLFCRRNTNGVILITTRDTKPGNLHILSASNRSSIPFAELIMIPDNSNRDTIRKRSDEKGIVDLQDMKVNQSYRIELSAFGHMSYKGTISSISGKDLEIELQPDYSQLDGVVLVSYPPTRCRTIICICGSSVRCSILYEDNITENIISFSRIFPNPLHSGSTLTCELDVAGKLAVNIQMINLQGQIIYRQSLVLANGMQRINIPTNKSWAKGMYLLSIDSGNALLNQERVLIQ